jgi:hypothetical protein
MTPADLIADLIIADLDRRGIRLFLRDGRLRASPAGAMTADDRAYVDQYRAGLIAHLSSPLATPVPSVTPSQPRENKAKVAVTDRNADPTRPTGDPSHGPDPSRPVREPSQQKCRENTGKPEGVTDVTDGNGVGEARDETSETLVSDLTPDQRELWEERAAIREYDGGYPRAEAERLALADVLQSGPGQ